MRLYWKKKEDRSEFDEDQKEAIAIYCWISFLIGALVAVVVTTISECLVEHLFWIW